MRTAMVVVSARVQPGKRATSVFVTEKIQSEKLVSQALANRRKGLVRATQTVAAGSSHHPSSLGKH